MDSEKRGHLVAVGIGSGDSSTLTPQAHDALEKADVIVGYKVYCDQMRLLFPDKIYMSSGMRQEVERCRMAIQEAANQTHTVAVICSGDAGVYGMAGLLLELLAKTEPSPDLEVTIIPGLTAALTSAAALGAPLMNDFAVISLSDLLTERATIVRRLEAVASSGMPCVLYNPRSRKRKELFDQALAIFRKAGGDALACGYVTNAGRPGEITWVGSIDVFPVEEIGMFTTVILGGSETRLLGGRLVTRRGYEKKYE